MDLEEYNWMNEHRTPITWQDVQEAIAYTTDEYQELSSFLKHRYPKYGVIKAGMRCMKLEGVGSLVFYICRHSIIMIPRRMHPDVVAMRYPRKPKNQ